MLSPPQNVPVIGNKTSKSNYVNDIRYITSISQLTSDFFYIIILARVHFRAAAIQHE